MDTLTNYVSSPILRAYYGAYEARARINRYMRRLDYDAKDGATNRAQWRINENEVLRGYGWRAHRALWGVYGDTVE